MRSELSDSDSVVGIAGILIIKEAILNLYEPHEIHSLDYGIYLVVSTALINLFLGRICVKKGEQTNSLLMIASGKHLLADTYTTLGIALGLVLMFFTKIHQYFSFLCFIYFQLVMLL